MNKKIKTIIIILLVLGLCNGIFYFFVKEDKNTSLTVAQKKWVEKNKNSVIDLSILDGVPVINENGSGLFFEFLNSLENDTGLDFNRLSYRKGGSAGSEYRLEVSEKVGNDILFYRDNYVIVTSKQLHFNSVEELKNLKIGCLKDELKKMKEYLDGSENLIYSSYEDATLLFSDLKEAKIDGIVLPRLDYLKEILGNDLNIAYNISEYPINYVLKLGDNKKLNKIIVKYFSNYKRNKYDKSYNKFLANTYFRYRGIDEKKQVDFRSKRYSFGFILEEPYMVNTQGKLYGFNYSFIKSFSSMANVEIDFKRYSSIENVVNDFDSNNLDLIYGDIDKSKFNMDVYKTVSLYDNKVNIISKNADLTVNNISSIKDYNIMVVKNSYAHEYLKDNDISTKTYSNVHELVNNMSGDEIALIDSYVYDYYVRRELKDCINIKTIDINKDFGFIGRNIKNNEIFNELLNFYITFSNSSSIINDSYKSVLLSNNDVMILELTLSVLVIFLIFILLMLLYRLYKRRGKHELKMSKSDKLRYLDSMTSLKNRDYLNDNISKWDDSKVYPQSVIIIDLNNVAYINDNFGHAEGDKVITEGAGVLIKNQLSDSEIVRTNGNEFLVFTIGHDEKDIVTYIRKLNREFKELSHGFGAAIGYSMIYDEIKTIDDAINEATIDMKNNKEELN